MNLSVSAKPISSPGRSDKFPPPLMRFLRSNAGSRSRGRSRASPLFLRKAHKTSASSVSAETTQEPSSPKVTCMGQVRVGRSKKRPQSKKPGRAAEDDRPGSRCGCVSQSLLCHHQPGRRWRRSWSSFSGGGGSRVELRRVSLTRLWRDCSAFFHPAGRRRRRPDIREEDLPSSKVESEPKFRISIASSERGEEDDVEVRSGGLEHEGTGGAGAAAFYMASSSPCTPPKNALLLTRCRSAPYRSSSLACRFWGSPLNGVGEETTGEQLRPPPGSEAESKVHPEQEEEDEAEDERFLKEETATVPVAERTANNAEESKPGEEEEVVMPRLTRCNSEPARTAAQKAGLRCGL